MALVKGTNNSELIDGSFGVTNEDDVIYGYAGNDTIKGAGGDDQIMGGEGADRLWGGDDDGDGDTALYGDSDEGVEVCLATGEGAHGTAEGDTLIGIENLVGSKYDDTLVGDDGGNTLDGWHGHDTLKGGGGIDTLYGGDGDDILLGGRGMDYLTGGDGADTLDGGEGHDGAYYLDSPVGVVVSLAQGAGLYGTAEGDTLVGIEALFGSDYDDILIGDDGDFNLLQSSFGKDTLKGGGGTDSLFAGADDDTLEGGAGADNLDGGGGIDTASYEGSSAAVAISLDTGSGKGGDAEGDTLKEIENLVGSEYDDTLWGNSAVNVFYGGDGKDDLIGAGGDDTLHGGDGVDSLYGQGDVDTLYGDAGNDFLYGGAGADTMNGGFDNDTYTVEDTGDIVIESIGQGSDRVKTSTTYSLAPGCEVEILETAGAKGTASIDLVGNEFNNAIIGNDGQNTIVGGLGLDILTGNKGGDTFVWTSGADSGPDAITADVVTDFNRPEGDLIALNPIDADGDAANGDQAFTFVDTAPFTAAGQISYYNTATDTYIQLNIDADGAPDMIIQLAGLHTPDASWFVL